MMWSRSSQREKPVQKQQRYCSNDPAPWLGRKPIRIPWSVLVSGIVLVTIASPFTCTSTATDAAACLPERPRAQNSTSGAHQPKYEVGPSIDSPGEKVYIVAAAAHATGVSNTTWVTDLVLYNLEPTATAAVNLFFMRSRAENSSAAPYSFTIPMGQALRLDDIVARTFGESSATGAIVIGSDQHLAVTSRTYNNSDVGTYGQYVPAVPMEQLIEGSQEARLIHLTSNGDYRTNIGFANPSFARIDIDVDVYTSDGAFIGRRTYSVPPFSHLQETDAVSLLSVSDISSAYAVLRSSGQSARFFAYASVVDNRTGDPILITPQEKAIEAGNSAYSLAAARVAGVSGTNWRTDLEVHNPGPGEATYRIDLLATGQDNSTPMSQTFTLHAGRSTRFEDILENVFSTNGTAALRITTVTGRIMISNRTYNHAAAGSYGQLVPCPEESMATTYGEAVFLLQLSYSPSASEGYRSNIGLVSATNAPIEINVALYSSLAVSLGLRSYTLQPYEHQQSTDVFQGTALDEQTDTYAIVYSTQPGASFFSYASVVDNRTGDAVLIPPSGLHPDMRPVQASGEEILAATEDSMELADVLQYASELGFVHGPEAAVRYQSPHGPAVLLGTLRSNTGQTIAIVYDPRPAPVFLPAFLVIPESEERVRVESRVGGLLIEREGGSGLPGVEVSVLWYGPARKSMLTSNCSELFRFYLECMVEELLSDPNALMCTVATALCLIGSGGSIIAAAPCLRQFAFGPCAEAFGSAAFNCADRLPYIECEDNDPCTTSTVCNKLGLCRGQFITECITGDGCCPDQCDLSTCGGFDFDCDYSCRSDTSHEIEWQMLACEPTIATAELFYEDYCQSTSDTDLVPFAYPPPLWEWLLWDGQHLAGEFESSLLGVGHYEVSFSNGKAEIAFSRAYMPPTTIVRDIWRSVTSFTDRTVTGEVDREDQYWGICVDDPTNWRVILKSTIVGEETFQCWLMAPLMATKQWSRECTAVVMKARNKCYFAIPPP